MLLTHWLSQLFSPFRKARRPLPRRRQHSRRRSLFAESQLLEDRTLLANTILQVSNGGAGDFAFQGSVSEDGRFVAFSSTQDLVIGNNLDRNPEIFLYEIGVGITQITQTTTGANFSPSLDADGSHIAFSSSSNDLPGSNNADQNLEIWLFQRGVGFTQITNTTTAGRDSDLPAINQDGSRIAFISDANVNGSGSGGDEFNDIWLYEAGTGFTRITTATAAISNFNPAINGDGTRIVFDSHENYKGQNADGSGEIFLYTMGSGLTQITSDPFGSSFNPDISSDGTRIVFDSNADLVGNNGERAVEIFLYDQGTGFTQITNANFFSELPVISGDGNRIAFQSYADFTGQNSEANQEIFLYESGVGFTQITNELGTFAGSTLTDIDGDGTRIVFDSQANHAGGNADLGNEVFAGLIDNKIVVDVFDDVVDGNTNPGQISLREAILLANESPGSNVIQLQPGTYRLSIAGRDEDGGLTGDLDITEALTIVGAVSGASIIDAQGIDRVFHIHGFANSPEVTFTGVTITGGVTTGGLTVGSGGGILNEGADLTVANSIVRQNRTGNNDGGVGEGGGIASLTGTLLVTNSTITQNATGSGNNSGGDGGGIGLFRANATIIDSIISNNQTGDGNSGSPFAGRGGGIAETGERDTGNLTIINSTITNNTVGDISHGGGGGIYTEGTLSLTGSTISSNTASYGGGIALESGLVTQILNSTISGNVADLAHSSLPNGGGGIHNNLGTITLISGSTISGNSVGSTFLQLGDGGGGIFSQGTIGAIENSTISGNTVAGTLGRGGGLYIVDDPNTTTPAIGTISFVTIANNSANDGGGFYLEASTTLSDLNRTLIADNVATGTTNEDFRRAGTVTTQARNLIEIATGHTITNGSNGSIVGSDPRLAPLASNGGPTQTHRLLAGSLAIDAGGTVGTGATDQRGVARPLGAAADIGAFESNSGTLASVVVDTLVDEDDGNYSAGDVSLREAAFLVAAGGTITFAQALNGGTITLGGTEILLNRSMTITGPGAGQIIVSGNNVSRLFSVGTTATVSITGLTLTGGLGASGGAISNQGTLTVNNSVFTGNRANSSGGAIFNTGTLNVSATDFTLNRALSGGAIFNSGTATISRATLSENTVTSSGGAVGNAGATSRLTISESTLSKNSATVGGAIIVNAGQVTITGTTISGNTAIGADPAQSGGGGIFSGGVLTLVNVTISGNVTNGIAGGIGTDSTTSATTLRNVTIFGNTAGAANGGGGYLFGTGSVTLHNTLIAGNKSSNGIIDDDLRTAAGTFTAATNNFVAVDNSPLVHGTNGNIVGGDWTTVINPMLANNGGPTRTHALLTGGAAIDAGNNAQALDPQGNPLAFDQRGAGFPRVLGARVDIGAFEANTPPLAVNDAYTVNQDESLQVGISSSLIRYNFDEASSGNGAALDSGEAPATNGTFQGSATRTGNTPGSGTMGALDLTGGTNSNNFVTAGDLDEIDNLNEMTITFWVNLQAAPKAGDALVVDLPTQINAPAGSKGFELRIENGTGGTISAGNFGVSFLIYSFDGTGFSGSGGGVAYSADNQWAFVALTCDFQGTFNAGQFWGGTTTSSVVQKATPFGFHTTLGGPNDGDLRIGGNALQSTTDLTPPLWIDDFRIFDQALSLAELEAVRKEGLGVLEPGVLENDTDADGDPLTAVLVTGPAHGTLTLRDDGSFDYRPNAGFSGTDSFTYKANDGKNDSNTATVTITVQSTTPPAPDLTPAQPGGWSDSLVVSTTPNTNTNASTFTIGDALFVDGAWRNAGDAAAGPFSVEFTLDGSQPILVNSPGLNSGLGIQFVEDLTYDGFLSAGTHTLAMNVDSANQVAESNETNNVRSREITVGLPPNATQLTVPVVDILAATPGQWLSRMDAITANAADVFTFTLSQAVGLFIDIDSRDIGLSSTLDTVIGLFDSAGRLIATNNDGFDFEGYRQPGNPTNSATAAGFFDSALYADLAAGTYYVAVRGANSTAGDYELRLLADAIYSTMVPEFNSFPQSGDTLYLDFDGHTGTDAWGNYTAAPFSLDADGTTFSPGDRLAIYNLWRTVAEDFSPFNINVSTTPPSAFNDTMRFRQIITNSPPTIIGQNDPNLLGIAFLGSYNQNDSSDNVGFTFANRHSDYGGGLNGRIMASAHEQANTTSHEFGHALTLNHYALSQHPNAIMVTTNSGFSRKTWNTASTDTGTPQNDMAIIADLGVNGIGYRADDHGNSIGTATLLTPVGNTFSAKGIISDLAVPDVDLFKFTLTSNATGTIIVDVDEYLNNLDVELRLLDAAGNPVAGMVSDPAGSFDAFLSGTLTAGTYYLEIQSDGDPGEAGQYALRMEFNGGVDTTPPSVSITRAGTSPTNADSVLFNVVFSEPVSNVDASDFLLARTGSVAANATVIVGNAGDEDDATYTVTVNAITGDGTLGLDIEPGTDIRDVTGNILNTTPTIDQVYVIDNTAPQAPVITAIAQDTGRSNSDGITSDATLVLAGTAEANSRVVLTRVGQGIIGFTFADGSGAWSFDYAGTVLPEGSHSFSATVSDAAGNTSGPSVAFLVIVDQTAPAASVIAAITQDTGRSSSDGITNDPTLVLSGTAEANSVVELTRVGVGIIGTATADGTGAWSFNYAGTTLPEGTHSFTATATDAAGNISLASAAFQVVIDLTAPAAPVINAITVDTGTSGSDRITNDPTLVLSGTAEPNAVVQLSRSGAGVIGSVTADSAGVWSFDYTGTSLGEGTHSFTATATDVAGNVSLASAEFTVIVDLTAPAAPVITAITTDGGSSGSDGITNDNTLILSGTAEANSVVQLSRNGLGVIGSATADATGVWSFDYTDTVLPEGTHSFTATASDTAGNTSAVSLAFTVIVDQTAPAAPVISAITDDTGRSSSDGITSDTTLILSGTAEANSRVTLTRIGTGVIGTVTADASGVWSFNYTGTVLPEGAHDFTATASDTAGNVSAVSAVFTVQIDQTAPAAPVIAAITQDTGRSNSDRITNDPTLVLSGTAEANSIVELTRVGVGILGTTLADGTGAWSFDYTGMVLPEGTHSFTAKATDAAGNLSLASAAFDAVVDLTAPSAPVITAITTDSGSSGSDRITNDPTLVLSGTTEANAIVQLSRSGVGVIGSVTANGTGAWTFDYTGTVLPEGNHSFTATATDVAGNISLASAAFDVVIDLTAPLAPVIAAIMDDTGVSNNDRVTSDSTLIFSGTAEANAVVQLTRVGMGVIGTAIADASGNWSVDYTATVLPDGVHNFTATATDAAGNTSAASLVFDVTVEGAVPTVRILRAGTSPTNADSVVFNLIFSEAVSNVDAEDFVLALTGSVTASTTLVVGSAGDADEATYTITVSSIAGEGTLGLDIFTGTNIQDSAGNLLNLTPTVDEVYVIDNTAPTVAFTRRTPLADTTNADSVTFDVIFSEIVTGVDAADFQLALTGTVNANATVVVADGGDLSAATYTVTVNNITGDGFLGLDLAGAASIQDLAGNTISTTPTVDETYLIDNIPPVVSIFRQTPLSDKTNADSVTFDVIFNQSVTSVDASDFLLGLTGTVNANAALLVGNAGDTNAATYTVTVNNIIGDGLLELRLAASRDIQDPAGNLVALGPIVSEVYTIDNTAPTVAFTRKTPPASPTNSDSVTFNVIFSEEVANVDAADFLRAVTGTVTTNTTLIVGDDGDGSAATYTVTINNIAGDGMLGLDLAGNADIQDQAGNALNPVPTADEVYVIDNTAPLAPVIQRILDDTGISPSDGITNDDTLILSGMAEANSVVTVTRVGVGVIGTATTDGTGLWSFDYTAATLPQGSQSFTATATDAAGNISPVSATFAVTIDRTAPGAPVITAITEDTGSNGSDGITSDAGLILSGTAEENSLVTITRVGTGVIGTATANGTGAWSFDYTGTLLPQGTHTFTATATDAAGNISAVSANFQVVVDQTAPDAPVIARITEDTGISTTDGITSDPTLIFTGLAEAHSLVELTRLGVGVIGTAQTDASGVWSFDYTGTALADGSYSFTATATDKAGNTSGLSLAFNVNVDSMAPSAPTITAITNDTGTSSTDGITSDPTLILSGTAEANSEVTVTRVGTGVIGTAIANAAGGWSFNYTGTVLAEGSHSFTATSADAAGNVSGASAVFSVTIDVTAPQAPVIASITDDTGASNSDGITNDPTLILSGTAEAGSVVELTRLGEGVIGTTLANASGSWSFDYTGTTLPEGTHGFTAKATDIAGNVSAASTTFQVVVDHTAPSAPVIAAITDDTGWSTTDGITNDATVVLSGTAESNSKVTLTRIGLGILGSTTADSNGAWSFDYTGTALPPGTHAFTAIATDAAGNTSGDSATFSVVVDQNAPAAPVINAIMDDTGASSTDRITNDARLILAGTAEANSVVELIRINVGVIGTTLADGNGVWTFDYTGTALPDGTHRFTARATDAAGNTSTASAEFDVVIDQIAPLAPVINAIADDTGISNSDKITSDANLVFSGTAEAGSVVKLSRSGVGVIGTVTANASGLWSFDYSGTTLAEGTHQFSATASDVAGNLGPVSLTLTVVVDQTAPAAPVITAIATDTGTSSSDGITNDGTLILSGTAEANSLVELTRVGVGVIGTTTADGTGAWSFDYTGTTLLPGDHSFTATAKDAAGNVSGPSATFLVVVDQASPAAPVISAISQDTGASGNDRITNDPTLIFSGTGEAGAVITLTRMGVGVIGTSAADANGTWTFDFTGTVLPPGTHTFTATATDTAGNFSPVSEAFVVVIDTTAPLAPVINAITEDTGRSSTDGITSDAALVLSGTAEANSRVELTRVGQGIIGFTFADGSGAWSFDYAGAVLPEGNYSFTATASDTAGNVSAVSSVFAVQIDQTAPAAPVIAAITNDTGRSSSDGITNDPTLVLSGTAEANSIVELTRVGVGVIGTALADGTGAWSFNYAGTTLPEGTHSFTATATDVAGNVSPLSAAFQVVVDLTAPAAPAITAVANDTGTSGSDRITNDRTLILSGTAEANAIVQLSRVGVGMIGSVTADGAGVWSFDYTGTVLPEGTHSFTATATDMAGNVSPASAAFDVVVDLTAPLAPVITAITTDSGSSGSDGITNDNTLVLSGTAEANSLVELSRNGAGVIGTATANGSGAWSFDYTGTVLSEGTYSFTATATDKAGNTSLASSAFNVRVDQTAPAAPVIASITDDTGISNNDRITNDRTLILRGTAEAGSIVEVTRAGVGFIGMATANASGAWSLDYTGTVLGEGNHSFTATATDAAGNRSGSSPVFDVAVDLTPPARPVITAIADDTGASSSDRLTRDNTLILSGTAEANSQVRLTRVGTGEIGSTMTDNAGNWSFDYSATALSNGTYNFTATVTDTAANVSPVSVTFTVIIDRTAPLAPAITAIADDTGASSSDEITQDRTLVLSGTAEANALVQITHVGVGIIGSATANGAGAWSFDYTGTTLPEGNNSFTATATDVAGNVSVPSATFLVVVDVTAPQPPRITGIADDTGANGSDGITGDSTLIFSGTAEAQSVVTLTRLGVGVIGTAIANATGAWSFDYTGTVLPTGTHSFTATATDAAGNISNVSEPFVVTMAGDAIAPTVRITRSGPSPTTLDALSFNIVFSEPVVNVNGSDFRLALTGTVTANTTLVVGNAGDSDAATYTVTVSGIGGDGTLGLDIASNTDIQDLNGNGLNTTPTVDEVYVIDNTAPAVPVITRISDDTGNKTDDAKTGDHTLFLHGTAEPGSLVELTLVGEGVIGTTTADANGNWTFDYTGTTLHNGRHDFTARAIDAFGNASSSSPRFNVVVHAPGRMAAGSGPGKAGRVDVVDPITNELLFTFEPYGGFAGGIRVATGDVNNDGTDDIITGPGPGGGPHIKVIDGVNGSEIRSFFAFDPSFTGGVFLASADLDGDNYADIVVGADAGGTPHVRVFSGKDGSELFSFLAFNKNFAGGVRVAVGDITGDGTPDIIAGAGPGAQPHVRVFDGETGEQVRGEIGSFFAFSASFRGGVFVAAGRVNNDAQVDIIAGADAGGGPHVRVFNGEPGRPDLTIINEFFAYDPSFTGGVRVSVSDVNLDGLADIITAAGPGGGPHVRILSATGPNGSLIELSSTFVLDPSSTGGVFISGNPDLTGPLDADPLRLAEGVETAKEALDALNLADVQVAFDAALQRLQAIGASPSVIEGLATLTLHVADLEGDLLAEAQPGAIVLDVNAAGVGWFIDPTPSSDEEFPAVSSLPDVNALGRIDLLTVILHELGHQMGGEDLDAETYPEHFLADRLSPGQRRLPKPEDLDLLFANSNLLESVFE